MKVKIEKTGNRFQEIKDYYENGAGQNTSLDRAVAELIQWFDGTSYIVGRGGSHVWVADQESGNRVLLLTA